MNEESVLESWIAHAEDDFNAANRLARGKKPLLYSACFHAQQCVEKYFKAMLVSKDTYFPKTHDLNTLHDLCNQAGIFAGMNKDTLGLLSSYAVVMRYPGDDPTPEETREAIETAKSIRQFARTFLGLKKQRIQRSGN